MFNVDFIDSLSEDPMEGAIQICDEIIGYHKEAKGAVELYNEYMKAYALITSYIEANQLSVGKINYSSDKNKNISDLVKAVSSIRLNLKHELNTQSIGDLKRKYQARFKGNFCYEFSEGDLARIQQLINELREQISTFPKFEEKHRQRLLRRLEKLQNELHKKVSDLDRFWGLIGDAGVVMRKFGEDAKPIVDRLVEIGNIAWRTQSIAEELPSGTSPPQLLNSGDKKTK